MIDEDELIAEVTELLSDLVADGSLELVATRHGPNALATELADVLEEEPNLDLEEWLLERDEVVELYADSDALRLRLRPTIHRLAKGDGEPKWNPELAAAIMQNPDDVHARLVFGDWLEQEGDPRGELVALQAAIAEQKVPPRDMTTSEPEHPLRRREASLFERFRTHLFGDLPRDQKLHFAYGYADGAEVDGVHLDQVFALHSSRFLRSLSVPFSVQRAAELLKAMASAKKSLPVTIETVKIGVPGSAAEAGTFVIDPILTSLPRLRHLQVAAENVQLDVLDLPSMKTLALHAQESLTFEGATIALPNLEELTLDGTSFTDDAAIRAIIVSPPPKLTVLRLHRLNNTSELLQLLISEAKLLANLRVLDFRKSALGRSETAVLVEHKDAFKHLERLDLRGLYLGDLENQLQGICKDVATGYADLGGEGDAMYDEDYDDYDEDEDEEGSYDDVEDPALIPNEDTHLDEDGLEEEVDEDAEPDEGGVDRGAPVSERERYDEPVE